MTDSADELNECPKCKAKTATTQTHADGSGRFYCTAPGCGFELAQEKQNMDKARGKLQDIRAQLFGE